MGCPIGSGSLFGSSDKYIKFQGGDAVAIEGANIVERQILNDLRFPYQQILRGRVVLKPGQVNYLLNHLGLGDNATFVSIAARYDPKSKIEEDNYVQFNYYPDLSKNYYLAQMLLLTGNTSHRVPQLYVTNPNANYAVTLDVMVAVIDDLYSYFSDTVNQSGLSFTDLAYTDIETYVPNHSIVVLDSTRDPLAYIAITAITSIYRSGLIITIQEETLGKIFLEFVNEYNALQAYSMLNYIWRNVGSDPAVIVNSSNIYVDNTPPVVYMHNNVGATSSGNPIILNGATFSGPYNTSMGYTFSTSMSLSQYGGTSSVILKSQLTTLLFQKAEDVKDGLIELDNNNVIVKDFNMARVNSITSIGTYSVSFAITDYAGNSVSPTASLNLTILS